MNKPKDSNKTVSSGNDEDFSSSMARLAELASKDLGPDKPKTENTTSVDEDLLTEFMKPKRKAKPKGFKEKWAGKTIKLNINPYVASGIAIVILSLGIIAAPRIAKHFEEKRLAEEAEQARLLEVAKNTDHKLKSYNVFDAAKDVSGSNGELKSKSITELVKTVEEGNKIAAVKAEEATQLALNTLSLKPEDVEINLLDIGVSDTGVSEENSLLDLNNPELFWDLNDLEETPQQTFDSKQTCSDGPVEVPNEEAYISDILQSYFVFGGKNC
jgi:hypothetical protein